MDLGVAPMLKASVCAGLAGIRAVFGICAGKSFLCKCRSRSRSAAARMAGALRQNIKVLRLPQMAV